MATDSTKIMVGAGTFSIGDYTSAGGAGSLTDVGDILTPYEIGSEFANFDVETERATGIVATYPLTDGHTIKVAMAESDPTWLRIAMGQPSANLTGTTPDKRLLVGDRAAQYHQATLVATGIGTTGVRTWTFWKLQVLSKEPIQVGKGVVQSYVVTFRALRDSTVATADKYYKQVDA